MEEKQKEVSIPTHNPFPPMQIPMGPSIERPVCSFYSKTGVCRYNERFVFSYFLFLRIICFILVVVEHIINRI
jgi:hypothetical protein